MGDMVLFKPICSHSRLVRKSSTMSLSISFRPLWLPYPNMSSSIFSQTENKSFSHRDRVQVQFDDIHSVGHRIKIHKVNPDTGNERGDIEIKDYVILSHGEDNRLPLHTLIMDVTMTHYRYGRTTQYTNRTLTRTSLQWCPSV
jgi:hypothetical protein